MAKLRGLGRGLDALLAGDEAPAPPGASVAPNSLPVASLRPGKFQPRTRMDQSALAELAESIKAQGLLQPIVVRSAHDGAYEILAGERRWRAAQIAGLADVPVLVKEVPDSAAIAVALIENIQREDLNAIEEASGLKRLIDEFGMTHDAAAQAIGRSRSAVSNLLRLLNLAAPVGALLLDNKLEMGHARALLPLAEAKQVELAQAIVARGLSVREAERLAQQASAAPKIKQAKAIDRDVRRLEEELSDSLGTRVTIKSGAKGKGKLEIAYHNLAQLEAILARLNRR